MKIPRLTATDFEAVCVRISMGQEIELPEDVIQLGVDLYREYLGTYHECKETGIWYGYNGPFGEMNEAYLLEWVKDGQDD